MTDNEIEKALAELEEVEKRADGGPWRTRLDGGEWLMLDGPNGTIAEMVVRETGRIDNMAEVMQTGLNAAFIAIASNAIPKMIAEVRLLRGLLRSALDESGCDGDLCMHAVGLLTVELIELMEDARVTGDLTSPRVELGARG